MMNVSLVQRAACWLVISGMLLEYRTQNTRSGPAQFVAVYSVRQSFPLVDDWKSRLRIS